MVGAEVVRKWQSSATEPHDLTSETQCRGAKIDAMWLTVARAVRVMLRRHQVCMPRAQDATTVAVVSYLQDDRKVSQLQVVKASGRNSVC